MQSLIPIDKIPCGIIVFNDFIKIISMNGSGREFIEKTKDCIPKVINDMVAKTLLNKASIGKIIKYSNSNDFFIWRITTELLERSSEVIVIVQDETITYQLGQTILKAERLAVAGHLAMGSLVEIRNPLTSAKGFCEFMKNHNHIEPEYIEIILNELKQIQDIIESCPFMGDNSQYSNLDLLYQRIWTCIGNNIDAYELIMVTDNFDNLNLTIAEEQVNNILGRLIRLLNIWLEENTHIIIWVEEQTQYISLNISAYCDVVYNKSGDRNLAAMIKGMEGKNNQLKLQVITNNRFIIKLQLPIIIPPYAGKGQGLNEQVLLSK